MRRSLLLAGSLAAAAALAGGGLVFTGAHATGADATGAQPYTNGPVYLTNVANGLNADLTRGHVADGQQIVQYPFNGGRNQQWWFERSGDRYRIKSNVNGAYCLGRRPRGGEPAAIVLRDCGGAGTDWEFRHAGGHTYRIADPSGAFLTVWDEHPSAGRELVASANSGTGGQWQLTEVRPRTEPLPAEADRRLDQLTFLTAHNAFANYGDARWAAANQFRGVRGQLDDGVRGLMLDTHWHAGDVYLCHTDDGGCGWLPGKDYAWPRQRFSDAMQTVVDWLDAHPDQIVTVMLEDYVEPHQLQAALSRVRGLDRLLFRAREEGVAERGWPRVSELVRNNRRLLIFDSPTKWGGDRESFGVMMARNWTVENHWSIGDLGRDWQCTSRWGDIPLTRAEPGFRRLFVMNHYRNVPTRITAAIDNGRLRERAENVCLPAARRKPNFLAVDFYGDGNARAAVEALNRYDYDGRP